MGIRNIRFLGVPTLRFFSNQFGIKNRHNPLLNYSKKNFSTRDYIEIKGGPLLTLYRGIVSCITLGSMVFFSIVLFLEDRDDFSFGHVSSRAQHVK